MRVFRSEQQPLEHHVPEDQSFVVLLTFVLQQVSRVSFFEPFVFFEVLALIVCFDLVQVPFQSLNRPVIEHLLLQFGANDKSVLSPEVEGLIVLLDRHNILIQACPLRPWEADALVHAFQEP